MRRALLVLLLAGPAAAAAAQEVVAVLGSDLKPYHEAYESFQAQLGRPVPLVALGEALPRSAKVVVAFGGKAAVQKYPGRVALVYGIAPGLVVGPDTHDGVTVKIAMEPAAAAVIEGMRRVQPGLKRAVVLWSSESFEPDAADLRKAGAAAGVEVSSEKIEDLADLAAALRRVQGSAEALWLTADPLLITPRNFETIREFSYGSGVAFYAPTEGLAQRGAVASIAVGYADIGRAAAAAAAGLLAGESPPAKQYSSNAALSVNLSAAKEVKLPVPAEALRRAAKVFP